MSTEENNSIEYSFSDDSGDARVVVYRPFSGIEVAYISAHMGEFDFSLIEKTYHHQYAGIHYCREGRIEQETDNEFFYLMPGDCSIVIQDQREKKFLLPLKHYHGICIGIEPAELDESLRVFLERCDCDPWKALHHVCGAMSHVVLRSSESAKAFFDDLYEVEEEQRSSYLKVKLPELFYRMKHSKVDNCYYDRSLVPRTQVELVKAVAEYISQNLNSKITVKQLTQEFGVSDTYLQNAFRSVYGMPVISFIRVQKMQSAAQVLIHTSRTIDEIAEEFGYENESKFSAAFKKIMGDPPGIFRKEHSKIKII